MIMLQTPNSVNHFELNYHVPLAYSNLDAAPPGRIITLVNSVEIQVLLAGAASRKQKA
jgi:hypothetical protein